MYAKRKYTDFTKYKVQNDLFFFNRFQFYLGPLIGC